MPNRKSKPPQTNLELLGDRLEVVSLQALLTNKKRPETRDAARLGDVLLPWYERTVAKPAQKMGRIAEVWQELVPANLAARCRLIGFDRGTLKVSMTSTTARSELESCLRSGLLRSLQTASKGALFRVKATVEAYREGSPNEGGI